MVLRIIFIFFICSSVYGQEETLLSKIENSRKLEVKKKEKRNRVNYWYDRVEKYEFKKINKEKFDFVFRYWQDDLLIELTKKKTVLKGYVYNFVTGIKYNQEEKVYLQLDTLNHIDTQLIYNHIKASNIKNIASSEDIPNWKQNYHYTPSYKIEIYDEGGYIFNDFIALNDQKEFIESKTIQEFINYLKVLANTEIIGRNFQNNNPYDCYFIQQGINVCKVLSKSEHRKRKKKAKKLLR